MHLEWFGTSVAAEPHMMKLPLDVMAADDLDAEVGDNCRGMGSSFRPSSGQQQTERGVANASQRRARAFRTSMARGVMLIHDAYVEELSPDATAGGLTNWCWS